MCFFFFQAEDGIRDIGVTGVQTCALPIFQGFAETLLSGALDDKANRKRFVEIIRDHARRLARLTDDLLKLSRIEAGRLELEIRPIRVEALVNGCVETARLNAKARGLQIQVD